MNATQTHDCSESVSLAGPTGARLERVTVENPYGFTACMVCNRANQMIGVALDYAKRQFTLVVFDEDCRILATAPLGGPTPGSFGGGYFYLDVNDQTIVIKGNTVASYDTADVAGDPDAPVELEPTWVSADLPTLATGSDGAGLYSVLPVWTATEPNTLWALLPGAYDIATGELGANAWMAAFRIEPTDNGAETHLFDALELDSQWNNNTFAVDEAGAYIVTNGLDAQGACTEGSLWAFALTNGKITVRWRQPYDNSGVFKTGMKNVGSGTTPSLLDDGDRRLVAIGDNATPRMHTVDWSGDLAATQGGVYAVTAFDAYDGRAIWEIPLGRGFPYCHEYGGL